MVPAVANRAWNAFVELDNSRSVAVGMVVVYQPIGHAGLHYFQSAHGITLQSWERRAILAMDSVRLPHLNQSESHDQDDVSAQPATPALFDALFGQ